MTDSYTAKTDRETTDRLESLLVLQTQLSVQASKAWEKWGHNESDFLPTFTYQFEGSEFVVEVVNGHPAGASYEALVLKIAYLEGCNRIFVMYEEEDNFVTF